MLTPYTYRGGVCLPETQSFNMMFYRIDIMEEIAKETGIMEPQTWQEVLEILPSLQQRGMNFYYPSPTQTVSSQSFARSCTSMRRFLYGRRLRSALDTPKPCRPSVFGPTSTPTSSWTSKPTFTTG